MQHPLQQPFNPDTYQNLAGVRRIERPVWDKRTGVRSLMKFYQFPPTIMHGGREFEYR